MTAMPCRPPSKVVEHVQDGLYGLSDGATVLVGGFGDSGIPFMLLDAIRDLGTRDLTIVSINAGRGSNGIAALINAGQVSRIICSFPRTAGSVAFEREYLARRIALELVPMGTLAERLRAGGAGIPAFYTRVAAGTELAAGKETRRFSGKTHILERAIQGDLAVVRAHCADPFGNLIYRGVERNLNPAIARAATRTFAEVTRIVGLGELAPAEITTSGAYVDYVIANQEEVTNG